jgi:hypothetical protein
MEGDDDEDGPGMGDYVVNEDGSMDRIAPVPESVRREAERRGVPLKPDHIPADQVEHYDRLPGPPRDLKSDRSTRS